VGAASWPQKAGRAGVLPPASALITRSGGPAKSHNAVQPPHLIGRSLDIHAQEVNREAELRGSERLLIFRGSG
jgi:hypothetical protein